MITSGTYIPMLNRDLVSDYNEHFQYVKPCFYFIL